MRRLAALALVGGVLVAAGWAVRRRYGPPLGPALRSAATEAAEVLATVRDAMAEREEQLRGALGLDVSPGTEPLGRDATRALLDDPAGARAAAAHH